MSTRRRVLLKVIEDLVQTLRQRIGLHKSEYVHGKISKHAQGEGGGHTAAAISERSWNKLTKDKPPFKSEQSDVCVARYKK